MLIPADHLMPGAPDSASAIHGAADPVERRAIPAEGFDTVDLKTAHELIEEASTMLTASSGLFEVGPSTTSSQRALSFGPFRLLPAQQLLLEGEAPVRLGSRSLEILAALVERAGQMVSKNELMTRVWPDTFVDENTLRVHVAGLRRALGDGQPGRRYVTNIPGHGYRFVASVDLSEPEGRPAPKNTAAERVHNLPISQVRALGRGNTIGALLDQLPKQRLITIVGTGGVGKTTVALALAEALLQAYEDGVWFVDLAPLSDASLVPGTVSSALGLTIEAENTVTGLIDLLRHKKMLVVLDSC